LVRRAVRRFAGTGIQRCNRTTRRLEEGQWFEAGILTGIENASMADDSEIETTEVPEDDVPLEYLDDEQDNRL
jgi:hypothetical protein